MSLIPFFYIENVIAGNAADILCPEEMSLREMLAKTGADVGL